MQLQSQLVFVVLGAILVLTQGYAVCPECRNGHYDCKNVYPRCSARVDHLCFSYGVYYCAEPKTCPECSIPGHKCVNNHPYCNKAVTVGLCYQGGKLICVERDVPTTVAPTTKVPTTVKPTTVAPPTTVNPLNRCLTPGLTSGCFLQCPASWIPLIGKTCSEGTCCTVLP